MYKHAKNIAAINQNSVSNEHFLSLQLSQKRYKSLVNSIDDCLWEINKNALYTGVSPQITQVLGFQPGEVIAKSPFDLMPPREAVRLRKIFKSIFNLKNLFKLLENIDLHKKGHSVCSETSSVPYFDSNNNFSGYRGIDSDITSRKKLERGRDNLLLTMDQMSEAALVISPDLTISFLNKTFYNLYGYSPDNIIGESITVLDASAQKEKNKYQKYFLNTAGTLMKLFTMPYGAIKSSTAAIVRLKICLLNVGYKLVMKQFDCGATNLDLNMQLG